MPSFEDFIGKAGSSAEQLFVWQILGQILGGLMTPFTNALTQAVLSADPNIPLAPDQAADLVAQQYIDTGTGSNWAAKSGVDTEPFVLMTELARGAADLGSAIAAFQRGYIGAGSGQPGEASLTGAFAKSGIIEDWWPVLEKLAVVLPSPAEIIDAYVKSQIEEGEATDRWKATGADPTWFTPAFDAAGEPPAAGQLADMVHRGFIPWTGTGPDALTFEQGIREGHTKNKWISLLQKIEEYLPPPRTTTAMFHDGQLTSSQAATLLAAYGLSPELTAAYLAPKSTTTTAAEKQLSRADIVSLYTDGLVTNAEAEKHLQALGYAQTDAASILELADVKKSAAQVTAAVTHIRTLFEGQKITEQEAERLLGELKVPADQAKSMIDTWALVVSQKVKTLTAAEIVDAWYYELISVGDASELLQNMGYDAHDAWLILNVKNKGAIKGFPDPGVK